MINAKLQREIDLKLRTFYFILTNLAAWLLMEFWQHASIQLWDILEYFSIHNKFNRHTILLILFTLMNIPGRNVT
jgi:hypothetical protein